jgi:glycosyltransferase involved in cell wall biosynthesis
MKKILIAITKGEIGGAQVFVRNLAFGLKKNGFDVTVALGSEHGDFLESELPRADIKLHFFNNLSRSFSPLRNFFLILEVRRYLKENPFDIVQLNSSNALFVALAAKLIKKSPKTIFTHHGLSFFDPRSTNLLGGFLIKISFKFLSLFVDKNVFVSERNFQDAINMNLIKKERAVVIYNETDVDFKTREASREFLEREFGVSIKDSFVVGSIGRLAYPKNYEFLIYAAADLTSSLHANYSKLIFVVIGSGPERARYEKLIKKYGLEENFYLLGEISDASRYIKAFDLFVLPSIYEGMPLTVIEAVSAGIPVLVSKVGGNPEIVDNDNSQLFELNSKAEFVKKLSKLMLSEKLCKDKSFKNKEVAKRFSAPSMVEEYEKVFNS